MTPNISITLNTPHVTIERYSELTGLSIDTINDMLADGRLPRHRLRKDKKREKVMINLAALTVDALSALEFCGYYRAGCVGCTGRFDADTLSHGAGTQADD